MSKEEGGEGVSVEKGDLDGCAYVCEEKIRCGWYSYDKGSNLCYLKFARGYFRNVTGTKNVISGSTQSGGCVLDAPCKAPYTKVGDRCVNYAEDVPQWGVEKSNNRRGFSQAKDLCENYGGKIPYSFQNSEPIKAIGDEWHWLRSPSVDDTCLAIRPGRYQDGAAYFPCDYKFKLSCEKDTIFPIPIPSYPEIVRLNNSLQYNYNYAPCAEKVRGKCKGGWLACQEPYRWVDDKCLLYAQDNPRWSIGKSNNRRNFRQSKQLCQKNGGNIPYSLQKSSPPRAAGDQWHWLNYPEKDNQCMAIRPGRYQDGAARFPCEYKFNMACQQAQTFPLTSPPPPRTVSLTSPSKYNYNYLPSTRQTLNGGRGGWVGCQQPYNWMGSRCMNYCQNVPQWGVNQSNNRRGFRQAQQLCNQYGGDLPYSFLHSEPTRDIRSNWHWINYPEVGNQCMAIRPGRYQDGASYFPCEYKFNIACQQSDSFALTAPPSPRVANINNPSQYDYHFQSGKWVGGRRQPLGYNSVINSRRFGKVREIGRGGKKNIPEMLAQSAARNPYLRYGQV
eukprot:TRINITY_DN62152_c0_g1_i1.p1 TRINITY_DN62152_c0_g1~~TRINITY_DN62152_c0_g1_i1.p1  ORF type:complete len:622 (+),score=103.65 TRINITY_DN62152_c0_g1_i1:196-1866(+)